MPAPSIAKYLARIPSANRSKAKFVAAVAAVVTPFAIARDVALSLPSAFDLDTAVGVQLDIVGLWIGRTRFVSIPLTGTYFTFDQPGQGFDQGIWFGPGAPTGSTVRLGDDQYRLLLKARALNNAWDGSIPHAYELYAVLFEGSPNDLLIHDNGDMTMELELTGPTLDLVTAALFTGGYLDIKPAGVRVSAYILPP